MKLKTTPVKDEAKANAVLDSCIRDHLNGHPRTFVITLRRTVERYEKEQEHLRSVGINAEPFYGMDAAVNGLYTEHKYEVDHPGSGYRMGPKIVSLFLSHYVLWNCMQYMPEDEWWVLEDDAEFGPDAIQKWQYYKKNLPNNWDLLWLGSCCTSDKSIEPVADGIYTVRYPLCTHAYAVSRRALPTLLEKHAKVWAPLDLALMFDSMPLLNVYTILPRMAKQFGTYISE